MYVRDGRDLVGSPVGDGRAPYSLPVYLKEFRSRNGRFPDTDAINLNS